MDFQWTESFDQDKASTKLRKVITGNGISTRKCEMQNYSLFARGMKSLLFFICFGLGVRPRSVVCFDRNAYELAEVLESSDFVGVRPAEKIGDVVCSCKVVIIAVQPNDEVLNGIKSFWYGPQDVVISIAAGVTIANMKEVLHDSARVLRAAELHGTTVISRETTVTIEDESLVVQLFRSVGYCTTESHLNTVTAISGSSLAYAFMAIDAAVDGGSMQGLPCDVAQKLAAHQMIDAAQKFLETGQHPIALKDSVCSDGGTTSYGINHLENENLRALVAGAWSNRGWP